MILFLRWNTSSENTTHRSIFSDGASSEWMLKTVTWGKILSWMLRYVEEQYYGQKCRVDGLVALLFHFCLGIICLPIPKKTDLPRTCIAEISLFNCYLCSSLCLRSGSHPTYLNANWRKSRVPGAHHWLPVKQHCKGYSLTLAKGYHWLRWFIKILEKSVGSLGNFPTNNGLYSPIGNCWWHILS